MSTAGVVFMRIGGLALLVAECVVALTALSFCEWWRLLHLLHMLLLHIVQLLLQLLPPLLIHIPLLRWRTKQARQATTKRLSK